jgi:hypothetical protein
MEENLYVDIGLLGHNTVWVHSYMPFQRHRLFPILGLALNTSEFSNVYITQDLMFSFCMINNLPIHPEHLGCRRLTVPSVSGNFLATGICG